MCLKTLLSLAHAPPDPPPSLPSSLLPQVWLAEAAETLNAHQWRCLNYLKRFGPAWLDARTQSDTPWTFTHRHIEYLPVGVLDCTWVRLFRYKCLLPKGVPLLPTEGKLCILLTTGCYVCPLCNHMPFTLSYTRHTAANLKRKLYFPHSSTILDGPKNSSCCNPVAYTN